MVRVVMARRASKQEDTGGVSSDTAHNRRVVAVIPLFQHMIEGKKLIIEHVS